MNTDMDNMDNLTSAAYRACVEALEASQAYLADQPEVYQMVKQALAQADQP